MNNTFTITKSSGTRELFSKQKIRLSLQKAGARSSLIDNVIENIINEKPHSSKQIHEIIMTILKKKNPAVAARYNIKHAIIELGPAGYPFEQFIAHLFSKQGYRTATNRIIRGYCVEHEIDVVAQKKNKHYMIECKFHNRLGAKSDVKVPLYLQARFNDVLRAWKKDKTHMHEFHQAWVVTNTTFTSQAIVYAQCMNIILLGWKYPKARGIIHLIDQFGLYPITTLTTLSRAQKKYFIQQGFVLCHDAQKYAHLFKQLGISPRTMNKLMKEAKAVCSLSSA